MTGLVADWRPAAACRGLDASLFFPARGEAQDDARSACTSCPVQTECLIEALTTPETGNHYSHGIRGGTSQRQRRQIHRWLNGDDIPFIPAPPLSPAQQATLAALADRGGVFHGTLPAFADTHVPGPTRPARQQTVRYMAGHGLLELHRTGPRTVDTITITPEGRRRLRATERTAA